MNRDVIFHGISHFNFKALCILYSGLYLVARLVNNCLAY